MTVEISVVPDRSGVATGAVDLGLQRRGGLQLRLGIAGNRAGDVGGILRDFGGRAGADVGEDARNGDGGQDADDRHHHHQFDERETLLIPFAHERSPCLNSREGQ